MKKISIRIAAAILVIYSCSCTVEEEYIPIDMRLDVLPESDMTTIDRKKVDLGRSLFWDPILSGDRTVACATCHHPDNGWADGRELSMGVIGKGIGNARNGGIVLSRNSPTILNTAYNGITSDSNLDPSQAPMFWDNRVSGLENQAREPILSANEMRGDAFPEEVAIDSILQRLKNIPEYASLFAASYPDGITEANLLGAIATFERTLVGSNSRFDQYVNGDSDALSTEELRGLEAFNANGCVTCHGGPMFSDYKLHAISVPENAQLTTIDDGDGQFRFRTPTLRNLIYTTPYMHNGTSATIEDAIAFYEDTGTGTSANPNVTADMLSPELLDVVLEETDIANMAAFLRALTDTDFETTIPESVPSGLTVGGN